MFGDFDARSYESTRAAAQQYMPTKRALTWAFKTYALFLLPSPQQLLAERREAKQASREADEKALQAGKKSEADLKRENAHFGGLKVRHDLNRSGLY